MALKKKSTKAYLIAAAVALLCVGLAVFALFGGDEQKKTLVQGNLLTNADFAALTGDQPDAWTQGMWVTSPGASYLNAVTLENGSTAVLIENAAPNDARYEQTVSVRENSFYRLSAKVRAEGVQEGMTGANLSFLGVYGTSESAYDTNGAYETLTVYAQTGKGQKEATVCLRLGGYGAENKGKAWFTDVSLEQVESVPVGEAVISIATPEPQKAQKEENTGADSRVKTIFALFAACAVYLALTLFVCVKLMGGKEKLLGQKGGVMPLAAGLAAAVALRLVLAATVDGYGVDIGCFSAWGGKMASGGPANFYEPGYFCDYPPAYMLVLGAIAALSNLLSLPLGGAGHAFLLKLVPIACDAAMAVVLYAAAKKKLGEKTALGLSVLLAFNPAFVIAGSCWGQIDAVLTVMIMLFLLCAQEGRWHLAIPVFALAVLAKPQAGLLAPLGVAALVKALLDKENRSRAAKSIGIGIGVGLAVTALIVVPFSIHQDSVFWLVDKYAETLGSYDYATLSTGNLMFLLGGNWTQNTNKAILGLTYGQLGMGLMALSFAAGIAVYLRGRGRSRLMLASAVTLQLIFCLGTKMHERYILPAIALLLLAYVENCDVRVLLAAIIASVAAALNIGAVLAFEHLIAPNLWLGYLIGVLQLLAAALTVWAAVCDALGREAVRLPQFEQRMKLGQAETSEAHDEHADEQQLREALLHEKDYRLHLRARDYAIMLAITAIYAVVAFVNLGVTKAPQDGYTSSAKGETVVIDLGERREDFAIYYYGGISDTQFSFAVSDDGVNYTTETGAFFNRGECFKWQAMRRPTLDANGEVTGASGSMLRFDGRYIRVTFEGAGSALWEVAAVDPDGKVIPPAFAEGAGALEGREADPMTLINEQDTVPDVPSYLNSMYFDEIYHGRTGYEHANSLHTYETTHPPLGKVFMSWCIDLFGMTPFAWRFAGALTGVLMIPAIYLLAIQLMHSTKWAALCALLLSADCMHFTQTRIATIDSFPVLFMMLMFLFMARYMQMSFYHQRLRDTLVPLALSGLFMGLAISSKWIGCYGAVGLAALFFFRFFTLWRQSIYAKAHQGEDPVFVRAANTFAKNGAKTIASCFVFFVFVPLVIYCLSYIPYLSAYGEVTWNLRTLRRIWDAQVLMFDYHANLVAEHYFASPWYEWPLIIKPMWFYNADYAPAGMASSILTFGNPAIWWTGLVGIVLALGMSIWRNALPMLGVIPGRKDETDRALPVIAVGFLSAYLPWVLVSRLTFIYHYFASVPWIIIATAQMLRTLERRNKKAAVGIAIALGASAVALFVLFYPLASGAVVPRAWCDAAAWFDGWLWY